MVAASIASYSLFMPNKYVSGRTLFAAGGENKEPVPQQMIQALFIKMTIKLRRELQVSSARLLTLNRFEQGFKITRAETLSTSTLNNFEEECRSVLDWTGKDLQ